MEEDSYYLRTIEVRGFQPPRMIDSPEKTPFSWARGILARDTTDNILTRNCKIKFTKAGTLRITFDNIGAMRNGMVRIGAARNELRRLSSDLALEY